MEIAGGLYNVVKVESRFCEDSLYVLAYLLCLGLYAAVNDLARCGDYRYLTRGKQQVSCYLCLAVGSYCRRCIVRAYSLQVEFLLMMLLS